MEDPIKQQVWIGITDTDYAMRYHQKRADKFSKRQEALSLTATIVIALGVIIPLITQLVGNYVAIKPEVGTTSAAILFLFAIIIHFTTNRKDYPTQIRISSTRYEEFRKLLSEWKQLWYSNATQDEVNDLNQSFLEIDYYEGTITSEPKLMKEAINESNKAISSEFGPTPDP